jgi:hypothetical protein
MEVCRKYFYTKKRQENVEKFDAFASPFLVQNMMLISEVRRPDWKFDMVIGITKFEYVHPILNCY